MTDKKISELTSNGGDLGQDGFDGVSPFGFTAGGTAGDAIHGNSFITWTATGTIYGAII